MDATWDAVLMACLAVACAQGWRITSDKGHHAAALKGAAQALGLSVNNYDELDTLRDWRNRKYRAGYSVLPDELAEAIDLVKPFLKSVADWFNLQHAPLLKRGMTSKALHPHDPGAHSASLFIPASPSSFLRRQESIPAF